LERVIPPGATAAQSDLIYEFSYDERDNLTHKKVPGKEEIEYRYNRRNLLGYYQDGNLRADDQWYAFRYDAYGRITEGGFFTAPTPPNNLGFDNATIFNTREEYGYGSGNEVDKLKTSEQRIGSTASFLERTMSYDACGRLTSSIGNSMANIGDLSSDGPNVFKESDKAQWHIKNPVLRKHGQLPEALLVVERAV